jgi:hypothetical protein
MGLLKSIFTAIGWLFRLLTKTSRTPEQKEIQQARKEAEETDEKIDESIDRNSRTLW